MLEFSFKLMFQWIGGITFSIIGLFFTYIAIKLALEKIAKQYKPMWYFIEFLYHRNKFIAWVQDKERHPKAPIQQQPKQTNHSIPNFETGSIYLSPRGNIIFYATKNNKGFGFTLKTNEWIEFDLTEYLEENSSKATSVDVGVFEKLLYKEANKRSLHNGPWTCLSQRPKPLGTYKFGSKYYFFVEYGLLLAIYANGHCQIIMDNNGKWSENSPENNI